MDIKGFGIPVLLLFIAYSVEWALPELYFSSTPD